MSRLDELKAEATGLQAKVDDLNGVRDELRARIDECKAEIAAIRTRLDPLNAAIIKLEAEDDEVVAILAEAAGDQPTGESNDG